MKNFNKTMRKGFTLVELLFVMAIIAILTGFAIVQLKGSTKAATLSSMKNDARNAITAEQSYFAQNQDYDTASCAPGGANVVNGKCKGQGTPAVNVSISSGNNLYLAKLNCSDGTVGYKVTVENPKKVPKKQVIYDSCTDGTIYTVTKK